MSRFLRAHAETIVVAAITALITAGAPAIAARLVNADRLEGRPGVACDATKAKRAGAYVATCATGRRAGLLPNNIIKRAPNAARLGGRPPADFDDAQTLEGKGAAAFLASDGKAADADNLDGVDSSGFYAAGSKVADSSHADVADRLQCVGCVEPWHEVGSPGEPSFSPNGCYQVGAPTSQPWTAFSPDYNSAAFFKDPFGVVHLKGLVACPEPEVLRSEPIFTLPAGYRPAKREVHVALTYSDAVGRITITPDGDVLPESARHEWISLDGITFRAAQ